MKNETLEEAQQRFVAMIVYDKLGIVYDLDHSLRITFATMSKEDVRKAKRKFRKLWRKLPNNKWLRLTSPAGRHFRHGIIKSDRRVTLKNVIRRQFIMKILKTIRSNSV